MSIFYISKRIGKHGVPFNLYKFRTMKEGKGPQSTSANDPRITKIGRFLRKYKLDELPQLLNVLKRDMNIVGPRPEVPEVVDQMTAEEKQVLLSVKPGITDLASLWNYNEEERLANKKDPHIFYMESIWPEKKRLQREYIHNRSLLLDIKIIIQTLLRIVWRKH